MQYAASEAEHVEFESYSTIEFSETLLDAQLARILREEMGILNLFEMQDKVFTHILSCSSRHVSSDVVLCAPTGSGKTLAFALPIVQSLRSRTIAKLRAVILLPTRDLARQVMRVFEILSTTFSISVAVAVGASSFEEESQGVCDCEILIATPGRLVDHVENNAKLSLKHVRFLVIDESDRLLEDSYQGWIDKIIPVLGDHNNGRTFSHLENTTFCRPMNGLPALALVPEVMSKCGSVFSGTSKEQVSKILVSATQTKNPMRLHGLDLRTPVFFEPRLSYGPNVMKDAGEHGRDDRSIFKVPEKLEERGWVVNEVNEKPAGLLILMGWIEPEFSRRKQKDQEYLFESGGAKLVFTNSVDSAHRLCRLLELCAFLLKKKGLILEMSGELSAERRQEVLSIINATKRAQEPDEFLTIVCSDVLARGMDMVTINTVINYDAPAHVNTYLHRAGRTARAGRSGKVFTLLTSKQARHFRRMVHEVDRGENKARTKNLTANLKRDGDSEVCLSIALQSLRRVLIRERLGLVSSGEPLQECIMQDLAFTHKSDVGIGNNDMGNAFDEVMTSNNDIGKKISSKRKYGMTSINEDSYGEGQDGEEEDTGEDRHDKEALGTDEMSDILFAQIARNWLVKTSPAVGHSQKESVR